MDIKFKQKLLQEAANEILNHTKSDMLAKHRALMTASLEKALTDFQNQLQTAINAFDYSSEDRSILLFEDHPDNVYYHDNLH